MTFLEKKDFFNLNKTESIQYIENNFHKKLLEFFSEIEQYFREEKNLHSLTLELFKQFSFEVKQHIEREYQKYFSFLKDATKKEKDQIFFKTLEHIEKGEHNELKTYIKGIISILEKENFEKIILEKIKNFYELLKITIEYEEIFIEKIRLEIF